MKTRRSIERRLFEAVALVLASAGCQPPPQAPGPVGPTMQPMEVVETPEFAAPPPEPVERPSGVSAERDPVGFCNAYKAGSTVDASKATTNGNRVVPQVMRWDAARGVVVCSITRDTVTTTVQVMHAPTCCPRPGMQRACPPPQLISVPGTQVLVENVELRPDGTVLSSNLAWHVTQAHEPRRHNCGRRPEGMSLEGACSEGDEVAEELARMAELEAASVPAFERLARELALHGAPAKLVRRARAAGRDEIRHARAMTELAIARGAVPRTAGAPRLPCRSLAEIARENVIEGCVREAFGAIVATYQAERAAPELREAFRKIAVDERRHCALAEDVHAWIAERLDREIVAELAVVRARAERELRRDLARGAEDTRVYEVLGLPEPARAAALFDAYFA